VAELDRRRVAAVLAADADLQLRPGRVRPSSTPIFTSLPTPPWSSVSNGSAVRISRGSTREELARVVAREAERRLRQVVRAEAEELGTFGDLVGRQRGARQLDHRADEVVDLDPGSAKTSAAPRGRPCPGRSARSRADERDHDLRLDLDAFLLHDARRLEDGARLHGGDLG
jgi:hypothetical protein